MNTFRKLAPVVPMPWPQIRLICWAWFLVSSSLGRSSASNLSVTIDMPANSAWIGSPYFLVPYDTGPYLSVCAFGGFETQDSFDESWGIGTTVTCRIRRDADGSYWDGSGWGTDAVDLSSDVNGFTQGDGRVWKCTAGLPVGPQIVEGSYTLTAHAAEGLSSDNAASQVICDFTPPVLTATWPQAGAALLSFPFIGGTAVDPPGRDVNGNPAPASGVARVSVSMWRQSDGAAWDGASWNLSPDFNGYFDVSVNNDNSWGFTLPAWAVGADDAYTLWASCSDRAGLGSGQRAVDLSFAVDTQPPAPPSFGFPASGGTVAGLPAISGTASDNAGGTGINRVLVSLERVSDNTFWDGSGWTGETYFTTTYNFVPTPVGFSPQVGWSAAGVWPSGSTLSNGSYRARAYAYDYAGNSTVSTNSFTVNKQNPTIGFTSPLNGAALSSFPFIYGTATAAPGLNIARVDLYIYKPSWGAYWDGTIWDDQNTTVFHTTLNSPTTWAFYGTLPSGADAADDTYSLIAYAYDDANNSSADVIYFSIDSTNPPPPIIEWPANGAALNSLPLIRGAGSDNPGGSGFQAVILFLTRQSDGNYWNGSAWDTFSFASILGANTSGTNWARDFGLPAGAALAEGAYSIATRSEDWANNLGDIRSNYFTIDLTPPLVSFLSSSADVTITAFGPVHGEASDPGGSGVQRVDLTLQRVGDGDYWDGSTWGSQPATLATTLQGTNWSRSIGLPSGSPLQSGAYALQAVAYDLAGNTSAIRQLVEVPAPPTILTVANGGTWRLLWPTNASGFNLETSPSLSAPNWTSVTQQVQVVNGYYVLVLGPPSGNQFFRLKR